MEKQLSMKMVANGMYCSEYCDFLNSCEWGMECYCYKGELYNTKVGKNFKYKRCDECIEKNGK